MVDVTNDIDEVGRRCRDTAARRPEPRHTLDRAASEVLVRVAHEMRQPLSAVSAAIHVIKDDADRSRRELACRVLERQCTRLSRLVEDLLVVARTGRDTTALSQGEGRSPSRALRPRRDAAIRRRGREDSSWTSWSRRSRAGFTETPFGWSRCFRTS